MRILKAIVICFVLCVNWMSICSATDVPDDGQLVFSPLDAVPDYLLRPYLNAVDPKWTLVGLVNLAKNVVTSAYTIPWGKLIDLELNEYSLNQDLATNVCIEINIVIAIPIHLVHAGCFDSYLHITTSNVKDGWYVFCRAWYHCKHLGFFSRMATPTDERNFYRRLGHYGGKRLLYVFTNCCHKFQDHS